MIKVVVDTNILVSHLISKSSNVKMLIDLAQSGQIQIFNTFKILLELKETIKKPKVKPLLGKHTSAFVAQFMYLCEFVEPDCKVEICRDPKDDKFLELAKFIDAQYIITGDKDLLEIGVFEGVKILSLSEFFGLFRSLQ
jgi:uncharacterized protein